MATTNYEDITPYSSLVDVDQLLQEEEARKKQKQLAEKKIMRTNAIGDALHLLMSAAGASQGATITPREPNPYILKSADRYRQLDEDFERRKEQLRLQDLGLKEKDKSYQLGLEQRDQNWQREDQKTAEQREYAGEILANQQTRDDAIRKEQYAQQKEMANINAANAAKMERMRTDENLREATEKQRLYKEAIASTPRNKMATEEDIPFIVPGSTETIYIRPQEIEEMYYQLTKDKQKYDVGLEQAMKDLMSNDVVRRESAVQVLKKHWDEVKTVLPEFREGKTTDPEQLKREEYYKKINRKIQEAQPGAFIKANDKGVTDVSSIFN